MPWERVHDNTIHKLLDSLKNNGEEENVARLATVMKDVAKRIVKRVIGSNNAARLARFRRRTVERSPEAEKYAVLIDTTNGCNLRCSFCTRRNATIVRMKSSEFDRILSRLDGHVSSLQLSCAWEYSIAKNAAEIVRVLGEHQLPNTSIYTNGNVLPDDLAEATIDARLESFVVSIGEAKRETYERIRTGGRFERVLSNIRKLDQRKKQRASRYPVLCANLTLINSNIDELPDFVELAHGLGIEQIRGRHLILNEPLDMDAEVIRDKSRANQIIEAAHGKASDYGMEFSVPRYSENVAPKRCRAPWQRLYISSNGDVSVCPRIHVYERIGNLLHQDLRGIVRGSRMRNLMRQFNRSAFANPVCRICLANKETEVPIEQGF